MSRPPFVVLALLILASSSVGQEADGNTFQTEEPRTAESRFESEIEKARGEYAKELSALKEKLNSKVSDIRDSYVKTLADLLKKTTQNGDLDEAIRIRDRMKVVAGLEVSIPNAEQELVAAKNRIQELESTIAKYEAKYRKIGRKSISALVGTWRWFSGSDIVVGATGKVITSDGNSGTAQAKDDSPGTFVFTWPSGSVDTLILSQEGNFLDGRSNGGVRVWAVKLK